MEALEELGLVFQDLGRLAALNRKLVAAANGDSNAIPRILSGELEITLSELLFDRYGRRTGRHWLESPTRGLKGAANRADPPILADKPGKREILRRAFETWQKLYGRDESMPFDGWLDALHAVESGIRQDRRVKNILKGPWLPLLIPRTDVRNDVPNYGEVLERFLIPLGRVHEETFPDRIRKNLLEDPRWDWKTWVQLDPVSRQNSLWAQAVNRPITALWFPAALRGYSVSAAREQMSALPERFVLAGAIEAVMALTGFMRELDGTYNWLHYDCAAVKHNADAFSIVLGAQTLCLESVSRDASEESHSAGLLVFL